MKVFRLIAIAMLLVAAGWTAARADGPKPPAADSATLFLMRFDRTPLTDEGPLGVEFDSPDNVQLVDGRFGKALDCANSAYMRLDLPEKAQPTEGLTIEAWVRWNGRSEGKMQRVVGRSGGYGLHFSASSPQIVWYVRPEGGEWKSLKAKIERREWTHLAGTYDGQAMRLYINGEQVAEEGNPGKLVPGSGAFYLGQDVGRKDGKSQNVFNGYLDEVRISRVARTEFMTGEPVMGKKPTAELKPVNADETAFRKQLTVLRADAPVNADGELDEPIWQKAPKSTLGDPVTGDKREITTLFQVANDDKNFYIGIVCNEKGQETFMPGTTDRDNYDIFSRDCVEVFIRPDATGGPFYQIVMNPWGGLWDRKWTGLREHDDGWNAPGMKVGKKLHADQWVMELAIPYSAFGVKAPGGKTKWRLNVARQELPAGEKGTWAITGGGFVNDTQMGVLEFAEALAPDEKDADVSTIQGAVIDDRGVAVSNCMVETPFGKIRTDSFGEYKIDGVRRGKVIVGVNSPRYERYFGEATVTRENEVLSPVRLTRIDQYRPAFGGPIGKGPVAWLRSSIDEPPDMTTKPDKAASLDMAATPGEWESRAVAFFANEALPAPSVRVTAPTGKAGAITAANVEARWTQRRLKRIAYSRMREEAVFNWRWLFREPPESIDAGHLRQLVVTVHVPESAKAGDYKFALELLSDNKKIASLPMSLEVLDFKLEKPDKRVGVWYRLNMKGRGPIPKPEDLIRRELKDLLEHGGDFLVSAARLKLARDDNGELRIGADRARSVIELFVDCGIKPPYLCQVNPNVAARLAGVKAPHGGGEAMAKALRENPKWVKAWTDSIKALDELNKQMNVGQFWYVWMDEVIGRGRMAPWIELAREAKTVSDTPIFISMHNRVQEKVDALDPYLDVRCYHGHTLDARIAEGYTWEKLKAELDRSGDKAWAYYNIRDIGVTSEWVRLCNGWWLWRSPLDGHAPWGHYCFEGSPFDDLDGDVHDFGYSVPNPDDPTELVSSLEWECYREGYDDLRYMTTLERLADEVAKKDPKNKAVAAARALRRKYWDFDPRVPALAEALTADDYAKRRAEMTEAIRALEKAGK